jgi:hypothetical protein
MCLARLRFTLKSEALGRLTPLRCSLFILCTRAQMQNSRPKESNADTAGTAILVDVAKAAPHAPPVPPVPPTYASPALPTAPAPPTAPTSPAYASPTSPTSPTTPTAPTYEPPTPPTAGAPLNSMGRKPHSIMKNVYTTICTSSPVREASE